MNQIAQEPRETGSYLFGEDEANEPIVTTRITQEQIRKQAHIANGGEVAQFDCPRCRGSGVWRGNYRNFPCMKCKGTGKVSQGVVAAHKGKVTKQMNMLKWREANADLIARLTAVSDWSDGARAYLADIETYGSLKDWKVEKATKLLDAIDAKRAEKREAKQAAAPVVEISAIEKLFATATENDVKKPVFRAEVITLSKAPATGRNAGALYVKGTQSGDYLGKITGGKFHAVYGAPADTIDHLMAVAANPGAEAIKYAAKFSRCGICGRSTIDPVSVRSAVGPVCAEKWGLEGLRESARDSLKEDE